MELTRIVGADIAADLHKSIAAVQDVLPEADALQARLAQHHGVFILGASAPARGADGAYRNIARFHAPSGVSHAQEKLIMTRFEREIWRIGAGAGQTVFDTPHGKIGIAICYDVEFPQTVRALTQAGAEIILAPSCTDTAHGYWRVRVGAQARALENQCFTVQSPTVGDAHWSPAVDTNVGAAGAYAPPDIGLPENGIVALGEVNKPGWVYADLDLDLIRAVRGGGQQLNNKHWDEQSDAAAQVVQFA
jgi:predicted amidohydrolase